MSSVPITIGTRNSLVKSLKGTEGRYGLSDYFRFKLIEVLGAFGFKFSPEARNQKAIYHLCNQVKNAVAHYNVCLEQLQSKTKVTNQRDFEKIALVDKDLRDQAQRITSSYQDLMKEAVKQAEECIGNSNRYKEAVKKALLEEFPKGPTLNLPPLMNNLVTFFCAEEIESRGLDAFLMNFDTHVMTAVANGYGTQDKIEALFNKNIMELYYKEINYYLDRVLKDLKFYNSNDLLGDARKNIEREIFGILNNNLPNKDLAQGMFLCYSDRTFTLQAISTLTELLPPEIIEDLQKKHEKITQLQTLEQQKKQTLDLIKFPKDQLDFLQKKRVTNFFEFNFENLRPFADAGELKELNDRLTVLENEEKSEGFQTVKNRIVENTKRLETLAERKDRKSSDLQNKSLEFENNNIVLNMEFREAMWKASLEGNLTREKIESMVNQQNENCKKNKEVEQQLQTLQKEYETVSKEYDECKSQLDQDRASIQKNGADQRKIKETKVTVSLEQLIQFNSQPDLFPFEDIKLLVRSHLDKEAVQIKALDAYGRELQKIEETLEKCLAYFESIEGYQKKPKEGIGGIPLEISDVKFAIPYLKEKDFEDRVIEKVRQVEHMRLKEPIKRIDTIITQFETMMGKKIKAGILENPSVPEQFKFGLSNLLPKDYTGDLGRKVERVKAEIRDEKKSEPVVSEAKLDKGKERVVASDVPVDPAPAMKPWFKDATNLVFDEDKIFDEKGNRVDPLEIGLFTMAK